MKYKLYFLRLQNKYRCFVFIWIYCCFVDMDISVVLIHLYLNKAATLMFQGGNMTKNIVVNMFKYEPNDIL
jgi:hypothetical protein